MQSIPDVNTNEVSLFYFPVQPELNIIKDSFPFFLFFFFLIFRTFQETLSDFFGIWKKLFLNLSFFSNEYMCYIVCGRVMCIKGNILFYLRLKM